MSLADRYPEGPKMSEYLREVADDDDFVPWPGDVKPEECPLRPHRGPEGPNEDIGVCPRCYSFAFSMRPEGETFGHHLPDCSLPLRHGSYCEPGGSGHPPAKKIRG